MIDFMYGFLVGWGLLIGILSALDLRRYHGYTPEPRTKDNTPPAQGPKGGTGRVETLPPYVVLKDHNDEESRYLHNGKQYTPEEWEAFEESYYAGEVEGS